MATTTAIKRRILFLPLAAMISMLVACSSGGNTQNPPPPPVNPVTIAFQPQPSPTINVGFSENVVAVVTNDPNNYGVQWSLTCQGDPGNKLGLCGTLFPLNTASGSPTTYTAPATISSNTLVVEVIAYSVDSPTTNVVAPISVLTFNSTLQPGNYVLQAQGVENAIPYQFAGVLTLDGQGNITGGEQTINFNGASESDSIVAVGSNYFLGSDGRGTITLNTNDQNIGGNGVETFAFAYVSSTQALISQMDLGDALTGASATGTMNLQTSIAAPAGSYAFVLNGTDVFDNFVPLGIGGVLDIGGDQTTVTGVTDEIISGAVKLTGASFASGSTISAPDAFGQIVLTLNGFSSASHTKPVTVILTGYIVCSNQIALIETDTLAESGVTPFAVTGGLANAQAANSYGNFTNASFSGNYVFGVNGVDLSPINSSFIPGTWTTAAVFNADGAGSLNSGSANQGYMDTFLQQNCVQTLCKTQQIIGAQISSTFTGSYSVDGTGRATVDNLNFVSAPPSPTYNPTYIFYLTGNGNSLLVLAAGDLTSNPKLHYPSLGTGIAFQQSSAAAAFTGPYAFSFTQVGSGGENDGTAVLNANSTTTPPSLAGLADANLETSAVQDSGFLGTFVNPTSNLPFAGTLYADPNAAIDAVFPLAPSLPMTVRYYPVSPDSGLWIETDLITPSPGSEQVSLGYYAARAPLCDGCPTPSRSSSHGAKRAQRKGLRRP